MLFVYFELYFSLFKYLDSYILPRHRYVLFSAVCISSKGEVKTLGHWMPLPNMECWEVREKAIWQYCRLVSLTLFLRYTPPITCCYPWYKLYINFGNELRYHCWRTEAPLLHSIYSCCPCQYVNIQSVARLLLVFRSVFMKTLPVTEAKLLMVEWINWRY